MYKTRYEINAPGTNNILLNWGRSNSTNWSVIKQVGWRPPSIHYFSTE